jgi:hypothetical protein
MKTSSSGNARSCNELTNPAAQAPVKAPAAGLLLAQSNLRDEQVGAGLLADRERHEQGNRKRVTRLLQDVCWRGTVAHRREISPVAARRLAPQPQYGVDAERFVLPDEAHWRVGCLSGGRASATTDRVHDPEPA